MIALDTNILFTPTVRTLLFISRRHAVSLIWRKVAPRGQSPGPACMNFSP
jgi:hypothetical protein